jgi:hypothetical protein
MKKYEYLIDTQCIELGKFHDGFEKVHTTKSARLFSTKVITETKLVDKYISEKEYLNKKGQEGWELVYVYENPVSFTSSIVRIYYFKREIE